MAHEPLGYGNRWYDKVARPEQVKVLRDLGLARGRVRTIWIVVQGLGILVAVAVYQLFAR